MTRIGPVALAFVGLISTVAAIELDVDAAKIDAALEIARSPEAERAAFHKPYVFATSAPIVESIEIITEFRRLVKIAETRIADGDRFFARNTLAAQEAIRPFQHHVSVVARVRFHPQNNYVVGPPVDVVLLDRFEPVPRLDLQSQTEFGFASGKPKPQLPVVGVITESVFDTAVVGQNYRTVVVRVEAKDMARLTIDFGRLR
jgi:hypothetical protein